MNEMLKALYDSFNEMAAQLQGQLDTIDTEEQKSKTSVLQVDKIRKALEKELSFEDGVNSRLVASILDRIIVKRESTKEEIHLDIHLKMGQIYETVYQPQKTSSQDNPLKKSIKEMFTMKLLFKQRFFSWFDSYDIYNENGDVVYTVQGQLSWGHCLKIFDAMGNEIGTVKERVLTFLPKFEMYLGDEYIGCISKEFTFFKPRFNIDCSGWSVEGDFFEWDYSILAPGGQHVATVSKELFNWTDTYVIDVLDPQDALCALMLVLAIDAEKCSRDQ